MPSLETEAIILRSTVFGEADKLVSFFSRTYGRLRGVAPAARKSRRRFGPALEPLTYVRLWFFERENRELTRLEQCEVLESFWDAAPEYEHSVALNHIAELCELLLPEREPHERNFRLTLMVLRCLREKMPVTSALVYFQVWTARLAGWLPEIDRCSRCGNPLQAEETTHVSLSMGHFYCSRCHQSGTRNLSAASRSIALKMLSQPLTHLTQEDWQPQHLAELQRLFLDLIEHHTERKLATRELLHVTH